MEMTSSFYLLQSRKGKCFICCIDGKDKLLYARLNVVWRRPSVCGQLLVRATTVQHRNIKLHGTTPHGSRMVSIDFNVAGSRSPTGQRSCPSAYVDNCLSGLTRQPVNVDKLLAAKLIHVGSKRLG
jgi:hypothetical protein